MNEKLPGQPAEGAGFTFAEYSAQSIATASYPLDGTGRMYVALGLCGESGEVAEKVKKFIRDWRQHPDYREFEKQTAGAIKLEIGDVLWYLAQCAKEWGWTLEECALANIEKLRSRKERGKLHGNGDNR